ncbi:MAG: copper chaperone PCu(A)C [Burkholderiales bacterium]
MNNAWARATAPRQTVPGVYLAIASKVDATLVAVHCEVAKIAELHVMKMDGSMMRMRAVDSIALPAGATVRHSQGGYHIMLFDLKRGITAGERVPLTLIVVDSKGKRSLIEASAQVRNLNGSEVHQHH